MNRISSESIADLFFQVNWLSDQAQHTDAYSGLSVNFWRDIIPRRLYQHLIGAQTGDRVELKLNSSELDNACEWTKTMVIDRKQFDSGRHIATVPHPRMGRFYAKGMLRDVSDIFRANLEPFRCIQANNGHLGVDLSHPLAQTPLNVKVTVGSILPKAYERGGALRHWGEVITQGIGMQARWKKRPTDFFSDDPFQRQDESADDKFYRHPRMVQHIDDAAIEMIQQIYTRFLDNRMRVLDLMSSWQSHLPAGVELEKVTGVGLNQTEMKNNTALSDFILQDLNRAPELPFETASFDAAICTVSVEYLTRPMDVFAEVARVLKPGGWFLVTFSNRWFKTKTIGIWPQLHEFERMGLVLEYFHRTPGFSNLHTYSIRGLERPVHDKYHGKIPNADPVYAVWGRRN